jgi:hypothetical protein
VEVITVVIFDKSPALQVAATNALAYYIEAAIITKKVL